MLKSMKIDEMEKKEDSKRSVLDRPDYPYGLELHIDERSFEKLGMTEAPDPGQMFMVVAKASVPEVHKSKHANGKDNIHFRLQIQDMDLKPHEEKEQDQDQKNTETVLYGE